MKIKYGIMGTARIIDRFVGAVRASEMGEVRALASRSLEKARERADGLGINTAYGSYEELVKDPDIDVIYVPTINHAHKENAMLALENGKHVLVEKPMTLSEKDTRELFDFARKKNLFIMEAQKSLFLPVTNEVKRILENDEIGKVHLFEYSISIPEVGFRWFYDKKSGGGALYGSGNYILAHAMNLTEEKLTSATGHATLSDEGVDLQCAFVLKSQGGVLIEGKITTMVQSDSILRIFGEKGKIEIHDFWKAREATVEIYGEPVRTISHPVEFEMVYEVDHVNECLVKGLHESPVMKSHYSIESAKITDDLWTEFLKAS
ncbi:Gfo/Idh/MocA family protein [Proteiniclasticum sp. C24MP]|uniref:Gfo/Idh/MocA family protein n=1 Tax=Proteiniclasticum sp. C24MP TaxID=3374101 RepID=UPI0037551C49